MAYNKQATSVAKKMGIEECFRDRIFEEFKKSMKELAIPKIKADKTKIPKIYIDLAIAAFQNKIAGSNSVFPCERKIENKELFNDISEAISQCIENLKKIGKEPTQDELRSAAEKLYTHFFPYFEEKE